MTRMTRMLCKWWSQESGWRFGVTTFTMATMRTIPGGRGMSRDRVLSGIFASIARGLARDRVSCKKAHASFCRSLQQHREAQVRMIEVRTGQNSCALNESNGA